MPTQIFLSEGFRRSFKKLHPNEKDLFYEKLALFIENHQHPSFRSKKLKGVHLLFESSINMSIRVIWKYEANRVILLLDIGHHNILRKY
jgi:mRNA-degrading endonuclease RelE of RelBE toxin-antitoxin system